MEERNRRALLRVVTAIALVASAPASALVQRAFVASNGSDSNPCSVISPCRSFAAAIAVAVSGGEVIVLDSAGYGPVVVTKAITIAAPPGIYAGVSVPGTGNTGIDVNAPSASVTLRGLTINGLGPDINNGILIESVGELYIDRVTISGFIGSGVGINATSATGSGGIFMTDVVVRDSGYAMTLGMAAPYKIEVERASVESNVYGIIVGGAASATLRDVSMRANAGAGLYASGGNGSSPTVECDRCVVADGTGPGVQNFSPGMGGAVLTIRHSVIARNVTGIQTDGPGSTYCTDATITGNGTGVAATSGGVNYSFGDNMLYANGTDGALTSASKQ